MPASSRKEETGHIFMEPRWHAFHIVPHTSDEQVRTLFDRKANQSEDSVVAIETWLHAVRGLMFVEKASKNNRKEAKDHAD